MTNRGAFILFEGIDRCGKTTQCKLLADFISKTQPVESIRFPERKSTIGQLIDSYLKSSSTEINDHTIHLLFSANRWESAPKIKENLEKGVTLVCDRYAPSGVCFSASKGVDWSWAMDSDRGLPAPDCVIFLNMPVEDALQRADFGNERFETREMQTTVRESFAKMMREEEGKERSTRWHCIDANRSIDEVHNDVVKIALETLERVKNTPVGSLWTK